MGQTQQFSFDCSGPLSLATAFGVLGSAIGAVFRIGSTFSHRPFFSTVPRPQTSGQICSAISLRLSRILVVGSTEASSMPRLFAKFFSACSLREPDTPSTTPTEQPTRFNSICIERAKSTGSVVAMEGGQGRIWLIKPGALYRLPRSTLRHIPRLLEPLQVRT
jgi:hypothetical protein